MARPKLVSPDQPFPVRVLLHFYEFLASLGLAVVLISAMAISLVFATFVEATFNTDVVQFYVYRSWWFCLIYALLAVNIFCAAAIRYPWKRHQTGFVITHIGLLMLLLSGAISRSKGIDAQVHVWEHDASQYAYDNAYHFDLQVNNNAKPSPIASPDPSEVEQHTIGFQPGLFNWSAYHDGFANWKVARPDLAWWFKPVFYVSMRNRTGNVLYNQDGIKLEVLDYYADCKWWENTPTMEVMLSMPNIKRPTEDGRMESAGERWIPIRLSVFKAPQQPKYKFGIGDSEQAGGGNLTFHMAGSRAATEAFMKCVPEEGSIGEKGQVILYAGGKTTVVDVQAGLDQEPKPIEGTKLKYKVTTYYPTAQLDQVKGQEFAWVEVPEKEGAEPRNPTVVIDVLDGDKQVDQLTLLANMPQMNMQGYDKQVFGDYWYDYGEKDAAQLMRGGPGGSRIDFIQGVAADAKDSDGVEWKRVYYRYWNRNKIVDSGELKSNGTEADAVNAFKMPIAQLRMYLKSFVSSDKPKAQPISRPFADSGPMRQTPAAKVLLTVDGKSDEFWVRANMNEPGVGLGEGSTRHTMKVGNREVQLSMPIEAHSIGFRIHLDQFERRLDPGTSQPSHYSSDVQYLDLVHDRFIMKLPAGSEKVQQVDVPASRNPTSVAKVGSLLYWLDDSKDGQSIFVQDLSQPNEPATQLVSKAGKGSRNLVVDVAGGKLWWFTKRRLRTDIDVLMQADLQGQSQAIIAGFESTPHGLTVDSTAGWVYFGNPADRSIGRVKTDGTGLNNEWLKSTGVVTSLAIDPAKKEVYFADATKRAICASSTEDPAIKVLYSYNKQAHPNSIAVDTERKRLYFSDDTPNGIDPNARKYLRDPAVDHSEPQQINTVIGVINLDKTSADPTIVSTKMMDKPGGLSVDAETGDVYFTQTALIKRNVWITMNAPDDFTEPVGGRDLRVFQESFDGPYVAGTPEYREFVPNRSDDPEVYKSVFSVNYDPGTALRYWGCLFVIGGIACMFYMRAYFFKPKRSAEPPAKGKAHLTKVESEVVSK